MTVAPPGIGSAERHLPDVVQQRGVLQVEHLTLGEAEVTADRGGERRHPLRVAGLGVATDLGQPRQGTDRLPVGRPDRRVAAHGELGQQQGKQEERDGDDAEGRSARAISAPVVLSAAVSPSAALAASVTARATGAWLGLPPHLR